VGSQAPITATCWQPSDTAARRSRRGHQFAVLFEGSSALSTSLNDRAPLVHPRSGAAALIDAAIAD
jgi:hypothetical protein